MSTLVPKPLIHLASIIIIRWLLIMISAPTTALAPVAALAMAGREANLLIVLFRLVIQARRLTIKPTNLPKIATLVIPPAFMRELIRADLALWRNKVLI